MEETPAKFTDWTGSSEYSVYKDLLVHKTSEFNSYFFIHNSRQTFVALRPTIKIVHDQFIEPVIGLALLEALKDKQTEFERIEVKELLQKAIVAFTVMKTVDNGMFVFDANGIHMRFDTLPYEKVMSNVNLKINDFLVRTKNNKRIEGEEYLKKAMKIVVDNPDDFEEYEAKEESSSSGIISTGGIVSI